MGKPMTRQSESQSGKKFKRQNDKQKMLKKSFPNKVSSFTYIDSERIFGEKERKGGNTSVTSKKSPNVYKGCPKIEKLKILTPLEKLSKNVGDLGKLIVAKGFEKLPKV